MDITAKIPEIKYKPLLCRELKKYSLNELKTALLKDTTFILGVDNQNQIAVSYWVSAKRTRSYPYARVYDSLGFTGKKVTIIPIVKDEGGKGDRDFLQWDTISLMSLLGVYVIIAYYTNAEKNTRFEDKITSQQYDVEYVKNEIQSLLAYQSDALHWNIMQTRKIQEIANKALDAYERISEKLNVKVHSREMAEKRIEEIVKSKEAFMDFSRELAKNAQKRESGVVHKNEKILSGKKATLTITNYLGGNYYFTADEARLKQNKILLIEAKNTKKSKLPAISDIKDGLLHMILFTNLEQVKINQKKYVPKAVLKLTTAKKFKIKNYAKTLDLLKKEAKTNKFLIELNNKFIN